MTHVLLVDDEPQILELLRLTLELNGHQVSSATSGPQAVDLARATPAEVALIDIVMSPLDGFETAERLRTLPRPPRILFMTGTADSDVVRRGREQSDGLLTKPFRAADLLHAIDRLTQP